MAHFLSDVTHCRLELRSGDEPTNPDLPIAGITHTHDYSGQIRCFQVVPCRSHGATDTSSLVTWTGELDGSIVVRQGLDGKTMRLVSEQQGKTFVFALLYAAPYVWAGYSDGYIRIFSTEKESIVMDIPLRKAHGGAITGLLLHKGHVFSCSVDWMIVQWDAVTLSPVPHSQLSGHSNAVRCMVAEGSRLYSGGDDFTIRCWDLDTAAQKDAPWPIAMHRDSVRSLVLHQVFLFSASNDGTLCVWNTQTAQLVRQLDARDCPINCLFLDPSSLRLWSAAQDGIISIWDIKRMTLVGTRKEHNNTNVPIVAGVARVNSVKCWTLGRDGAVNIWYSDSDAGTREFQQLEEMEQSLQDHVEQYRQRIIDNYKALEQCKAELVELERRDRRKKELLSMAFAGVHKKAQCRIAVANGLRWRDMKRFLAPRVALARDAAAICTKKVLWGYFVRWELYGKQHRELAQKRMLQQHLARTERSILVKAYVQKMSIAARVQQRLTWLDSVSWSLLRKHSLLVLAPAFGKWLRFQGEQNKRRKNSDFATAHACAARRAQLTSCWTKLRDANRSARLSDRVQQTIALLSQACTQSLCRGAFRKLREFAREQFQKKLQARAGQFLEALNSRRRLSEAFSTWALLAHRRARDSAQRELCAQVDKMEKLSAVLKENESTTEEQLEAQLRERQLLLARILAENEDLDEEIHSLEQRKRALQREAMRDVSIDSTAPPQQQLSEAVMYLKARGVSAFHDIQEIQKAREEAKTNGPDAVIRNGIETVRKVFARVLRPAKLRDPGSVDWYVDDVFAKIKRKSVERASVGLCKMVTALDMINPTSMNAWVEVAADGKLCWDSKHGYNREILSNLGPLLELAIRSYRYRRNEDPETGEAIAPKIQKPKKAKRKQDESGNSQVPKKLKAKTSSAVATAAKKKKVLPAASSASKQVKKKKLKKRKGGKKKVKPSNEMIATPMEELVALEDVVRKRDDEADPVTKEDPQCAVKEAAPVAVAAPEETTVEEASEPQPTLESPSRGRTLERLELEEF